MRATTCIATGVDRTRLDGIDAYTALKIVGEIGLDMTRWPTGKHVASWLGLSPGSKVAGGKKLSRRGKPSANRRRPCAWRPVPLPQPAPRWGPSIAA